MQHKDLSETENLCGEIISYKLIFVFPFLYDFLLMFLTRIQWFNSFLMFLTNNKIITKFLFFQNILKILIQNIKIT